MRNALAVSFAFVTVVLLSPLILVIKLCGKPYYKDT